MARSSAEPGTKVELEIPEVLEAARPAVKLGLLAFLVLMACGGGVASSQVEPAPAQPSRPVSQEGQPSVVGRVVDVDGKPLPFVSVGICRANGALMPPLWSFLTRWTRTDADGRFSMPGVPPGEYKILPFAGIEIIGQKTKPEEIPAEFREYADKPGTHRLAKPLPGAFAKTIIRVKANEKPAEIEIKAVPHHRLTVRFIDSEGKPARAWPAAFPIYGSLNEKDHDWDGWFDLVPGTTDTMTAVIPSTLKDFWIQDHRDNVWWTWQPGSPRLTHDKIRMKRLDGDRLEIVAQRFRSNSLEIRVKPTAGKLPDDVDVSLSYGGSIPRRVAEGVYRLDDMILPGRDCQVMISADGFDDASTRPFRFLQEGELGVVEVAIKPGVRRNVWKSSEAQMVELKTPEGQIIPQLVEDQGPARKITCRAVDGSTGKPVADALVKVEIDRRIREDGDEPFQERIERSEESLSRTDAEGRFIVSIPEKFITDRTPGAWTTASLTVSEPRYVSFWDSLSVKDLAKQPVTDDFPTFRTVKMKPGRRITGRLVGADGEPLTEVQLYQSFPLTKETMIPDLGQTDDDGRFAFNGPVGVALKLEFRALKSARMYHDIPADRDDLGEIRITSGVRVRGQILDGKGVPVPLLSVTTPAIPQPDNQPNFLETTDKEGRFQTDELPAGKYQAVVGDFFYDEEGHKTAYNSRLAPGLYVPVPFEIVEGQPAPELIIRPVPHVEFVARLTTTRAKITPRENNDKPMSEEESKQAMLEFSMGIAGLAVKGTYNGAPWTSSASYLCFDDEMKTCRIRVPIGLLDARIDLGNLPQRFRIGTDGPELFGPAYRLAKVETGLAAIGLRRYRETTLKVELTTPDGKPADASKLEAHYVRQPAMRQAGVIFDSSPLQPVVEGSTARLSVLPDEEIRLTTPGSDPVVVRLSEGESRTITLTVPGR